MRSIPSLINYPVAQHGNARQSGNQPNKCFNCGEIGHYAKFCPRPRIQSNVAARPQNGGHPPLQVKGTSGFAGSNLDAFLRVTVGNQVHDCLLDTGSEVCLIPEYIVDPAYIRRTDRTLKAANGTCIPIQGEATLTIGIGQLITEITGLVSKHVTEPMLGIDFLVENGAVWDFNNSVITFGDQTFMLHPRQDKHQWCRRVVLQESVVVPPRSQVNVPTKVEVNKLPTKYDNADWGTEPSPVRAGLHVSRTH